MLADFTVEQCSTTGTSNPYALSVGVLSGYQAWSAAGIASGTVVIYVAKTAPSSPGGMKYEMGYGALTTGSPWTIARTGIIKSSNGNAAVDWQSQDIYYVMSAPFDAALAGLMVGNMATSRPAWAQAGFEWLDKTAGLATRWLRKLYSGSADIETGRLHVVNGVYTAAMSMDAIDIGAAGVTVDDTHRDKFLDFNVTAAGRTCTLSAGASYAKGFAFGVYGYGSLANNVALTPNGSETINDGAGGAALNILGGAPKIVRWDHVRGAWRVHG